MFNNGGRVEHNMQTFNKKKNEKIVYFKIAILGITGWWASHGRSFIFGKENYNG